ncbi:MAG: hypothetical protein AAF654_10950 [Myxococcota bacterium]
MKLYDWGIINKDTREVRRVPNKDRSDGLFTSETIGHDAAMYAADQAGPEWRYHLIDIKHLDPSPPEP